MAIRFDRADLTVVDAERAAESLRIALPWFRARGGADGEFGDMKTAWMHLGMDDAYVSLNQTSAAEVAEREGSKQTGINHVGFIVDDVDALLGRYGPLEFRWSLVDESSSRKRLHATDPDGIMWQFVRYLSDDPAVKNDYSI